MMGISKSLVRARERAIDCPLEIKASTYRLSIGSGFEARHRHRHLLTCENKSPKLQEKETRMKKMREY